MGKQVRNRTGTLYVIVIFISAERTFRSCIYALVVYFLAANNYTVTRKTFHIIHLVREFRRLIVRI